MSIVRRSLAALLIALVAAPSVHAQAPSHVINPSELTQALQERVSQARADREAIATLLQREDVKQIAAGAGLSLEKAQAAVATLEGSELRELAGYARQAQNELAGGASTIVISTTTIIIVLLIIILIVVIAD